MRAIALLGLTTGCATITSAVVGTSHEERTLRPREPDAHLSCNGAPCDGAHLHISTTDENVGAYLAILAAEGGCFALAKTQWQSDAAAQVCGTMLLLDGAMTVLAVGMGGMFTTRSKYSLEKEPVELRFGQDSIRLEAYALGDAEPSFDSAVMFRRMKSRTRQGFCRAVKGEHVSVAFAPISTKYGATPDDAASLGDAVRADVAALFPDAEVVPREAPHDFLPELSVTEKSLFAPKANAMLGVDVWAEGGIVAWGSSVAESPRDLPPGIKPMYERLKDVCHR